MSKFPRWFPPVLAVLLAGLLSAFAALLQCPACGKEAREGDKVCRFCLKYLDPKDDPANGGRPDAPAVPEAAAEEAEPDTTAAPLDRAPAERDAADARQALQRGELPLAALLARNALSLHSLGREKKEDLVLEMKALIRKAESGMLVRPAACPICKGSGTRLDLVLNLQGETKKVQGPNLTCLGCKGRKQVFALVAADDFRVETARATEAFQRMQEAKGLVRVGMAWLPATLDPAILPLAATTRLRQASVPACDTCLGATKVACATCDGLGLLPCKNGECVSGRMLCPTCDGKKMEPVQVGAQNAMRSCRTCSGRGIAPCDTCEGQGYMTCVKCEGLRGVICRDCKGTGEPAVCTRCRGEGLSECTRCRGTGLYREKKCESCQGQKQALCQSCQGSGRRKR